MTPELLREIGEALYGPEWKRSFCIEFDVTDRTLRGWMSGRAGIPDSVRADIRARIEARAGHLTELMEKL